MPSRLAIFATLIGQAFGIIDVPQSRKTSGNRVQPV
jgi:hypothetical protein